MNIDAFEDFDPQLQLGSYLLSGPTGSGKTFALLDVFRNWKEFTSQPNDIGLFVLCYRIYQEVYTQMLDCLPADCKVKLFTGLPAQLADPDFYKDVGQNKCVVLVVDDAHLILSSDKSAFPTVSTLVTVLGHHKRVWQFYCSQDFCASSSSALSLLKKNIRGCFIFAPQSDGSLVSLQKHFMRGRSGIISAALKIAKQGGRRFIFIDSQAESENRLRVGLGPADQAILLRPI